MHLTLRRDRARLISRPLCNVSCTLPMVESAADAFRTPPPTAQRRRRAKARPAPSEDPNFCMARARSSFDVLSRPPMRWNAPENYRNGRRAIQALLDGDLGHRSGVARWRVHKPACSATVILHSSGPAKCSRIPFVASNSKVPATKATPRRRTDMERHHPIGSKNAYVAPDETRARPGARRERTTRRPGALRGKERIERCEPIGSRG